MNIQSNRMNCNNYYITDCLFCVKRIDIYFNCLHSFQTLRKSTSNSRHFCITTPTILNSFWFQTSFEKLWTKQLRWKIRCAKNYHVNSRVYSKDIIASDIQTFRFLLFKIEIESLRFCSSDSVLFLISFLYQKQ